MIPVPGEQSYSEPSKFGNEGHSFWSSLTVLPLTHCSLMDYSTFIYWKSLFAIKEVLGVIF